jgi:dephospho-CoA kinase
MSRWPGKYVIGLTGNICAGKSEVCSLLVELGTYHVDADVIASYTLARGTPEFALVVGEFGESILREDGKIDRGRLGEVVFADAAALTRLEAIVHPAIGREIERIISEADHLTVVLEAIKLLESGLGADCDAIWVVVAEPEARRRRLMAREGMGAEAAQQRIGMQTAQEEKLKRADVIIDNNGSLSQTCVQVRRAWGKIGQL